MWIVGFLIRRAPRLLLTLFFATSVIFFATRVAPGNPINTMLAASQIAASPHILAEYRDRFGLNLPLPLQYLYWLKNLPTGEWGNSIAYGTPVLPLVLSALRATAIIAVGAAVLAIVCGTALGSVIAWLTTWRKGTSSRAVGGTLGALPVVLITAPQFAVGLGLEYLFAVRLGWLPATGMHTAGNAGIGDLAKHAILPTITLATLGIGVAARIARTSLAEIMAEGHILGARARGLRPLMIVRYLMRSAATVIITNGGLLLAGLISASFVVENVFAWPGFGQLTVTAIEGRDYPVVEGCALVIALTYVALNVLVDVAYPVIDPRLRARYANAGLRLRATDPGPTVSLPTVSSGEQGLVYGE